MVCFHDATAGLTFKWSQSSTLSDLPLTPDCCLLKERPLPSGTRHAPPFLTFVGYPNLNLASKPALVLSGLLRVRLDKPTCTAQSVAELPATNALPYEGSRISVVLAVVLSPSTRIAY